MGPKPKCNVAVVGCGFWGPNLIRNFNTLAAGSVKLACDLDEERLIHMKSLYPAIEITAEFEKVIDSSVIDVVVIATPVRYHFEMAKESLLAGKHTFVEKPMASSAAECKELIEIAESQNLTISVGHTFIYSPPVRKIKELVSRDILGDIQLMGDS